MISVAEARAVYRQMVPKQILLPCEHSDAVVSLPLHVEADPVRVVANGLDDVQASLALGSVELVRSYCQMWTRWLAHSMIRLGQS